MFCFASSQGARVILFCSHLGSIFPIPSVSVERHFFDPTREAFTSSARYVEVAWNEFLKCMELYIFIRNNMLRIEEIIFGKTYSDLFEEFKKMLAAAGAPVVSTLEDSWHHIPLSEVLVVVVALPLIE